MPYQRWANTCACATYSRTGDPTCPDCGQPRERAGWSYGMHEAMAAYQSLYRLKPTGAHRPLADESFRDLTAPCSACNGAGAVDAPPGWTPCAPCLGLGRVFTVPPEVVDGVRAQILEAFPGAAAAPVSGFPGGPVIHSLATGEMLGVGDPSPEPAALRAAMHPAYFRVRFRWEGEEVPEWPAEFVIVTAYATTGEHWSEEQNEAANDALDAQLVRLGVWVEPLTGYAPDSGHAEPGYVAVLSLAAGRALGRAFRQDAIFHVRGDALSVVKCDGPGQLVSVGGFRERLDCV